MPVLTLTLEGSRIHDIATLYAELNRVFMADEDWQLGQSLDALDDLLYGGYGALRGHERATLVWRDIAQSRAALGVAATRAWLEAKLAQPGRFDTTRFARELAALEAGAGQTYFDIVREIIAGHANLTLVEA